jgi:hypothetical protein
MGLFSENMGYYVNYIVFPYEFLLRQSSIYVRIVLFLSGRFVKQFIFFSFASDGALRSVSAARSVAENQPLQRPNPHAHGSDR